MNLEPYKNYKEFSAFEFQPLHDRVLLKAEEEEIKTKGGIIIVQQSVKGQMKGQVIAVGKGIGEIPLETQIGQTVLFDKMYKLTLEFKEGEFILIQEKHIIGVYENG